MWQSPTDGTPERRGQGDRRDPDGQQNVVRERVRGFREVECVFLVADRRERTDAGQREYVGEDVSHDGKCPDGDAEQPRPERDKTEERTVPRRTRREKRGASGQRETGGCC